MPWWVWLIVAGMASGAYSSTASASPGTQTGQGVARLDLLYEQVRRAGLSRDWEVFLAAVAHHESRWYASAHNGSKGERAASRSAYERNAAQFAGCGRAASEYEFGSGGWYGLLPANAIVGAFRGTDAICLDPRAVFDPWLSTLLAISYARNLLGWQSFKRSDGTWLALNRGWALPGAMDTPRSGSDARFLKGLRAQGVPEAFARQPVSALPADWHALTYLGASA